MSHLINIVNDQNEETLSNNVRPFPIALAILIRTKNHGALETLTKSQFHHTNLNLTNFKLWTNWQVFSFNEIELNDECEPDP